MAQNSLDLTFPDGFLWGTATAAHQVEGANDNNDWWDWEQVPGHIHDGTSSAVACDWWKGERYREDFDLARSLNQNAHRLSVEWSRIEPREGEWNENAMAYYRRVLSALRERRMLPMVTLHHFSNPRWLAQMGGWENQAAVMHFERFTTRVVEGLGDLCDLWVTFNEPMGFIYAGYVNGNWPPGKRNFGLAMRVGLNMVRGHATAYHAIHKIQPKASVGVAFPIRAIKPAHPDSWLNRVLAGMQNRAYNETWLMALIDGKIRFPMPRGRVPEAAGTLDYFGLNHYFSSRVTVDPSLPHQLFGRLVPPKPWGTSLDEKLSKWHGHADLDPEAFYETIHWLSGFGKPIYITENGICDPGDEIRTRYLVTHLIKMHRAIREGAPVKGYFYWTLVDNFEWQEGFSLPFGLFAIDLATQKRTPRPTAPIYAQIACDNKVSQSLVAQYAN